MSKNLYTKDEIILCTYLAIYGYNEFSEIDIHKKYNRSLNSIRMKVKNIAAMLDEEGITRYSNIRGLSGVSAGENGRRTNWNWVEESIPFSKRELFSKCESFLHTHELENIS